MSALPALLLPTALLALAAGPGDRPGTGEPAPAFEAASSGGGTVSLANFKGKQAVVLAFFPKAFTPG
jgi:peroxiredoxin Q/BCP